MARRVSEEDESGQVAVASVCGMDVAYKGDAGAGAAAVLSYPELELLESNVVRGTTPVPYIPTFLAFREMPFLVRLMSRLETRPSVFMINGHGIYHPASLGLASHFGVAFDVPAIGVAEGLLKIQGQYDEGEYIYDNGKKVCCALAGGACGGKRRIYVSPGHRMTLGRAVELARSCPSGHSRPEPLFLADKISKKAIRGADGNG